MNSFALLLTVERQLVGREAMREAMEILSDILNAVTKFILLPNHQNALSTETSRADLARIIKYV